MAAAATLFVPLNILEEFKWRESTVAETLSRTMPNTRSFMGVGIFVNTCM